MKRSLQVRKLNDRTSPSIKDARTSTINKVVLLASGRRTCMRDPQTKLGIDGAPHGAAILNRLFFWSAVANRRSLRLPVLSIAVDE
jgi:hypothetical protein